jgi:membrane-bound inhibitor of C-type lysozyme
MTGLWPIRYRLGLLAIATTLGACTGSSAHGTAVVLAERNVDDIPQLTTFSFACDDGTTVVANHRDESFVNLFLPGNTVRLAHVPSGSGARYSDGAITYWNKGRIATIERADESTTRCEEQRRLSIIEDAKLRGVDYWARGNEPGWMLEIAWDSIRFVTGYATEHYRFATPEPVVDTSEKRAIYRALADDHTLTVTITYIRCGDSMSDEEFEGTVELRFDDQKLRGCGQALH